jgi:molybdopterin molybdotransferase
MAVETSQPPALIPVDEARQAVLACFEPLPGVTIPVHESAGRFALDNNFSLTALPCFDNSAMDGYAVDHRDLSGATRENPRILPLAGEIPAGATDIPALSSGNCLRIFTGAPLPPGATAVVMQEDTFRTEDGRIAFMDSPSPWEFVRFEGEDIGRGDMIVQRGSRINSRTVGLLAAAGIGRIHVGARPGVSILSTGSELVPPGQNLGPGQIHESNSHMLSAMVSSCGGIPETGAPAGDSLPQLVERLQSMLENSDLILTSGGISVGAHDLVREAWAQMGGRWTTSRISMKPGKPFSMGLLGGHKLLALPGNPVSAAMTFMLFAYPAMLKMAGSSSTDAPLRAATMNESISNRENRTQFIRVVVDDENKLRSAGQQGSHHLRSLAESSGYIELSPGETVSEGSRVMFTPWPSAEAL